MLLRRYLGAVVEHAIAQIERPSMRTAPRRARWNGFRPSRRLRITAHLSRAGHRSGAPLRARLTAPAGLGGLVRARVRTAGLTTARWFVIVPILGAAATRSMRSSMATAILDIDDFEPYALLTLLLIGVAVTALSGIVGGMLARQLAMPLVTLTRGGERPSRRTGGVFGCTARRRSGSAQPRLCGSRGPAQRLSSTRTGIHALCEP